MCAHTEGVELSSGSKESRTAPMSVQWPTPSTSEFPLPASVILLQRLGDRERRTHNVCSIMFVPGTKKNKHKNQFSKEPLSALSEKHIGARWTHQTNTWKMNPIQHVGKKGQSGISRAGLVRDYHNEQHRSQLPRHSDSDRPYSVLLIHKALTCPTGPGCLYRGPPW